MKRSARKYPFIDSQAQEIAGTDSYVRMIQEMKAGMAKSWDVNYVAFDMYPEYLPYQKKFDILGMAQQGVLQIPQKMIDPVNRHVVVVASDLQVVAFNKKQIAAEKIPNTWEGFLREEFKGRKFISTFARRTWRRSFRRGAWKKLWILPGSWRPSSRCGSGGTVEQ
jgi:Bacterial extracellular solute-binding protein